MLILMSRTAYRSVAHGLLVGLLGLLPLRLHADPVKPANLARLIQRADLILVGTITQVHDGFLGTIPYTEVTVAVEESLRGTPGPVFTFRQFGLLAPRDLGNGYTNTNTTPAGWARYAPGESVLLFLNRQVSRNGLRTPVGLAQGKFVLHAGYATNGLANAGLFHDLSIPTGVTLSAPMQALLTQPSGPVETPTLLAFVRRAVQEHWYP